MIIPIIRHGINNKNCLARSERYVSLHLESECRSVSVGEVRPAMIRVEREPMTSSLKGGTVSKEEKDF